ncbi:OsmC family peroxiredoxin [Saccharopolyspora rhizosphaerae]|uniref:OsmC family peroxiredoxin n=1 Tax=Saccharopolyspora rhizosphaerae TaxID=2492662 RepID=A0A3R8R4J0_9PSEU|nr:OsmC family protein [Saccharopolyspora rhizosphaerae]RRO18142.1 OsmC family peroxiredoxin [Saccharopolyspora rhizosphaerae]
MSSTPVEVTRTGEHTFTATNARGAEVAVGRDGAPGAFTPGELLLAAVAACSAITSENLFVRRIGEDARLVAHADRTKDTEDEHKFAEIQVSLEAELDGVQDRDKLLDAVQRAVEKYCTVSRSVEESTPIILTLPR